MLILKERTVMKNTTRTLGIFLLFAFGAFHNVNNHKYSVRKIVIDAGHGGRDPGALGRYSKEKHITLRIALELGKLIKQHMKGVEVVYTRKEDVFMTLHDRAKAANKNNADIFLSIHCNASPKNKNAQGTETYTMGLHASTHNLEVAKRENSVVLMEKNYQVDYQGFDPKLPESHILFSLYQNAYNDQSLQLAQRIQYQFKNRVKRKSRGVKQAGLLVLWKTAAPSVLIEVGFITNAQEEKYLNSKLGRSYLAAGIFRALRDYKCVLETKS